MTCNFEKCAVSPQPRRLQDRGGRSIEQITQHYLIERELATRLRKASRDERGPLYSLLYDELFQRVPDHPMLVRKSDVELQMQHVQGLLRLIRPFLRSDATFLELGPGDCSLSLTVCRHVQFVYAVDVSNEITNLENPPDNFSLLLCDGREVPVLSRSISVAFSNQLIEHLHPEDAFEQTANIFTALEEGGVYICLSPNRLSGPHDISMYFDEVATGLHLKEYTNTDLAKLLSKCGFSRVRAILSLKGFQVIVPTKVVSIIERIICLLPQGVRRPCAQSRLMRALLGVCLVAWK